MTLRVDAIGMVVTDLPATLAFWRELGLDIDPAADQAPHAEAELPGGFRLMWDPVSTIHTFDPGWSKPDGQNATLAVRCDSPAEVDATVERLRSEGHAVRTEPWDAPWGQRYATVLDPDGYGVDLYASAP